MLKENALLQAFGPFQGLSALPEAQPHCPYSEQQNHSTKSQISLVCQIVAQRTKAKLWENNMTKKNILSFDMPSYGSLVPAIGLIWILQCGPLDGTVLLLVLGLGPVGSLFTWPGSQSHFYKPSLLFYPIPPATAPTAYPHQ